MERDSINFKGNTYPLKCKSIGAGVPVLPLEFRKIGG